MAENLGDGFYMSKQNVDVYRFVSGMLYIQNVFNKLCCHLVRPMLVSWPFCLAMLKPRLQVLSVDCRLLQSSPRLPATERQKFFVCQIDVLSS